MSSSVAAHAEHEAHAEHAEHEAHAELIDPLTAGAAISTRDAFDRLCIAATQVEALANAANTAMDQYGAPPAGACREFDRVHALVSATAESADAFVELTRTLKGMLRKLCRCGPPER